MKFNRLFWIVVIGFFAIKLVLNESDRIDRAQDEESARQRESKAPMAKIAQEMSEKFPVPKFGNGVRVRGGYMDEVEKRLAKVKADMETRPVTPTATKAKPIVDNTSGK